MDSLVILSYGLASAAAATGAGTSAAAGGTGTSAAGAITAAAAALESINSAKLEIAPVYVINYSVLVLNGETPVIVEHILETGSKIKGKSTLCILSSRRV